MTYVDCLRTPVCVTVMAAASLAGLASPTLSGSNPVVLCCGFCSGPDDTLCGLSLASQLDYSAGDLMLSLA